MTAVTRPRRHRPARARQGGITVLEMLVVLILIGFMGYLGYGAVRRLTRRDLVEDTVRVASILRRTSELASETGKLHRVTFDLDKGAILVESCEGAAQVRRLRGGDKVVEGKEAEAQIANQQQRLRSAASTAQQPGAPGQFASPEDEAKTAAALAGHHVGDQTCTQVTDVSSGDAEGKPLGFVLDKEKDIKLREIWVQHRDESQISGQVSIFFFPIGSAEKAIIELTDGAESFSVRVHGLTGRVELVDGPVQDANDFMMRNVEGEREPER